ncbi:MAG: ABC transporter substrate-binding protein [Candidatus Lambdaproteobacteria bacterium RIFOXYD12_FULL_49_8]|nr:MAG: ABC transporter substrate-binding protein [Candidatus Lambdaproteobacteria bacterium RIFOXYD12_FULL_49_8]
MKRRDLVKAAGAGALLTAAGILAGCEKKDAAPKAIEGAPAISLGKNFEWKMVTAWPKNFPGLGTGANYLAQLIGELSGGRLKVKVYGGGELVPPLEVFDAVSKGTAQMGHAGAYYWKGKAEAAQFFSAVPFGLNAQEMIGWIRHGGGQELWDEVYRPFGLKPFPAGNTGVQMGGWFNKEINKVEDFKGLKMRMPGLGGEVLNKLGATSVSLPGGEIFQSLQSGAIDATEWVGPYNDLAFGFYKVAKYYYWPGWHEPGTVLECFVNQKALDELPKDLQAIVEVSCRAAYDNMLAEYSARNNLALMTLINEHKVQLKRFSDPVLRELGRVSQIVVAETAARDPLSAKVYQSFDQFRKGAISWDKIGEEGYSLARALTFT